MAINIQSLHGRLLNLAKEKKIELQLLLNRLGAEQFLFCLSQSDYAENFVFKGGSLLTYLIDSDRKTKDLDFSVNNVSNEVDDVIHVVQSILHSDELFEWTKIEGKVLEHPEMQQPGVRVTCRFLLGEMKGIVHMDMAMGDLKGAAKSTIERMRYKNAPLLGNDFSLLVYTPEMIFAEKFLISVRKGAQNTRMKDYFDLLKLMNHDMDENQLKLKIQETFANRKMQFTRSISFNEKELERLQTYWEHFLKREKILEAPDQIVEIISKINVYLEKLHEK